MQQYVVTIYWMLSLPFQLKNQLDKKKRDSQTQSANMISKYSERLRDLLNYKGLPLF